MTIDLMKLRRNRFLALQNAVNDIGSLIIDDNCATMSAAVAPDEVVTDEAVKAFIGAGGFYQRGKSIQQCAKEGLTAALPYLTRPQARQPHPDTLQSSKDSTADVKYYHRKCGCSDPETPHTYRTVDERKGERRSGSSVPQMGRRRWDDRRQGAGR